MKNYKELSNSEKVSIVNSLISICELIATEHHTKKTISWDLMVELRSRLKDSDIDEYMYEVLENVNKFLSYRN